MVKFSIGLLTVLCMLKIVASSHGSHGSPKESAEDGSDENGHKVQECRCGNKDDPICSSNGGTYMNICHFKCALAANRKLKRISCKQQNHESEESKEKSESSSTEIKPVKRSCFCGRHYKPVCGSNGQTYANKCLLNCAKKRLPHLAVMSKETCPVNRKKSRGLKKSNRRSHISESKSCFCKQVNHPVCGSDGETYKNRCLLNCERKTNTDLKIVKHEACGNDEGSPESSGQHSREYVPTGSPRRGRSVEEAGRAPGVIEPAPIEITQVKKAV